MAGTRGIGILAALLATLAGAAPGDRLRVPMPSPRPMGYRDPGGAPRGFAVDALSEAAARRGLTIEWAPPLDTRSNNEALRRGDLDLVVGPPSAERRREFYVSDPWWSLELLVLVPGTNAVREESQLGAVRIAIPTGAGSDLQERYPGATSVPVPSAAEAAKTVCQGTADAAVVAAMYLRELLLATPEPCRGFPLRTLDSKQVVDYALIARPAVASAARSLKRGLDKITADGTLASIAARYPPVSTPHATRLAEVLRLSYRQRLMAIAGAAAALLMALGGVFLIQQAAARRRLRAANLQLQRDLEARTRAEAALRQSEERFRALFESAPLAVLAYDDAEKIVFANAESRRMFGAGKLVGTSARPLLREFAEGAGKGLRADGREFPIEVRLGRVGALVLAFIADTSERVALEQQLLQSQKLESLGQLAGGVAHDFNNLLTVITGYAHLGLEDLAPEDPRRDSFQEIADAAARAAALTGQLLAFSRRQAAKPRVLSLNELLRNIEKMLRRLIGEDIELVLEAGEIGPVSADPGQIEQIVMNLAVNARDARPHGGRLPISTAPAPGERVAIRVADTGTGMPPEVRDRVFEPFFTTKEQGKGTGLGLSTVYGIVKQAGGEVLVETEVGRGTTFTIVLPVADGPLDAGESPRPGAGDRGSGTILLAEDEPGVRRFVSSVLSANGYCVLEAANGREALEMAAGHAGRIDLLLTDVVMPEMGGFDLAGRLLEARPRTAVLHMCGYSDRVLEEGAALLRKPFSPGELLARVREALERGA
jgi:signal transduction histidine kinase/CheY-like chemotaxis protein